MLKNNDFHLCFKAFTHDITGLVAIKLIAIFVFAAAPLSAAAAPRQLQSGVVTKVVDGDTLWVQTHSSARPLKVRIQGIDAPEICQAGGLQARDALKRKVGGQRVGVTSRAHDDYGRTVGTVHMQNEDIGRWMVGQGHAWVYKYQSRKALYSDEFSRAQQERRGVFSVAGPEEPKAFRKRQGNCRSR